MRSFLYIPGNRRKMLDKTAALAADAFILDLEDFVPPVEKANARVLVREYAGRITKPSRLGSDKRGSRSDFYVDDLDAIVGAAGVAGLFIPKVDSAEQVAAMDRQLRELEQGVAVSRRKRPGSF